MYNNVEIISVHIPKTAGTSLRNMILQHYGSDRVCTHYPDSPEVDGTKELTDSTKVIHGHFFIREYLERYPEIASDRVKKIAWLRHPVTRVMSHYFYNKKYPFSIRQDMTKLSLLDYAKLPWKQNEMSKHLEGVALEDYYFIGIQEFFAEDLRELQTLMGWHDLQTNIRDNSSMSEQYYQLIKETLSQPKILEQIISLNAEDMELYEQALRLRGKRRQESSQIYAVQIGWQWAQTQLENMESKLEQAEQNSGSKLFLQMNSSVDDLTFINNVYFTYLKREPDEEGRDNYLQQLRQGVLTREDVLDIIASSEESKLAQTAPVSELEQFLQSNAQVDNNSFVTNVYQFFLNRYPDDEGQANYVFQLGQNLITRQELVETIMASEEYQSLQMAVQSAA